MTDRHTAILKAMHHNFGSQDKEVIIGDGICTVSEEFMEYLIDRLRMDFQQYGTMGGLSKSPQKILASRENGKKGGRPRKHPR